MLNKKTGKKAVNQMWAFQSFILIIFQSKSQVFKRKMGCQSH